MSSGNSLTEKKGSNSNKVVTSSFKSGEGNAEDIESEISQDDKDAHPMLIGEFAVSGRLSMATVDDFFVVDEKERRQNEVFADQPNVTIVDADLGMDTKKLKNSGSSKKKVGSVKSIRSSILKSKNETLAEFEKNSLTYRLGSPEDRVATGTSPGNPKSIRFSAVDQDDIFDESDVK